MNRWILRVISAGMVPSADVREDCIQEIYSAFKKRPISVRPRRIVAIHHTCMTNHPDKRESSTSRSIFFRSSKESTIKADENYRLRLLTESYAERGEMWMKYQTLLRLTQPNRSPSKQAESYMARQTTLETLSLFQRKNANVWWSPSEHGWKTWVPLVQIACHHLKYDCRYSQGC